MNNRAVKDLQPGDLIRSHGCVLEVLETPHLSSIHDPFGRDMLVFPVRLREVVDAADAQGKQPGATGDMVYGPDVYTELADG